MFICRAGLILGLTSARRDDMNLVALWLESGVEP
jgi:hypothetical protein